MVKNRFLAFATNFRNRIFEKLSATFPNTRTHGQTPPKFVILKSLYSCALSKSSPECCSLSQNSRENILPTCTRRRAATSGRCSRRNNPAAARTRRRWGTSASKPYFCNDIVFFGRNFQILFFDATKFAKIANIGNIEIWGLRFQIFNFAKIEIWVLNDQQ